MNFTNCVAEVIGIVGRPDKVEDVRREVNAAINFFSIEANFARDLIETSATLDGTLYAQSLALNTLPRWRKFLYLRPVNRKKYLTRRNANAIFANGDEELDTYYIAGDNVIFKLCQLSTSLLIGYFTYPPILTDAAPDYWLLDISPFMVIYKAASNILAAIGNNEDSVMYDKRANVLYESAKNDYRYGSSYGA